MLAEALLERVRCDTCVLVIAAEDSVARWAAQPIDLGCGSRYVPLVVGPSGIPEVTDPRSARQDPELAVLSAMAHGRDSDLGKVVQIAMAAAAASAGLDGARSTLYFDLVAAAMSEAARKVFQSMDPAQYEYQSEFARRYVAEGRAEGEAKGRAELLLRLLAQRFGPLSGAVEDRVRTASIEHLDEFAERVLTARNVQEVLGSG